mmetsp:Transcript_51670/g.102730  ORF Transcript_51670/g.102730 Transcript_51670/m.102730 type:complete len:125 (-) Transcript_51670:116-490(-)
MLSAGSGRPPGTFLCILRLLACFVVVHTFFHWLLPVFPVQVAARGQTKKYKGHNQGNKLSRTEAAFLEFGFGSGLERRSTNDINCDDRSPDCDCFTLPRIEDRPNCVAINAKSKHSCNPSCQDS